MGRRRWRPAPARYARLRVPNSPGLPRDPDCKSSRHTQASKRQATLYPSYTLRVRSKESESSGGRLARPGIPVRGGGRVVRGGGRPDWPGWPSKAEPARRPLRLAPHVVVMPWSVACRACTSTSGCLCRASPFRCARRRFRMSLAALRLHHGRRTGDAVPEGAAVAGATPLFRCLVRHRGGLDVHAHPPSVGRSLRSSNPVREGHRSLGTGASRTWRLGLWPEPSGVPRPCSVMPGCQTAGRSANG